MRFRRASGSSCRGRPLIPLPMSGYVSLGVGPPSEPTCWRPSDLPRLPPDSHRRSGRARSVVAKPWRSSMTWLPTPPGQRDRTDSPEVLPPFSVSTRGAPEHSNLAAVVPWTGLQLPSGSAFRLSRPLGGLRRPLASRPYFVPLTLMGFALQSFSLPESRTPLGAVAPVRFGTSPAPCVQ